MKTKALLVLALFLGVFSTVQAQQSSWNWPEDKKTATEKNAYYTDSKSMGNYREAANALSWLLIHAPDLNASIYINGTDIYNELVSAEKDPAKQKVYQDSVLVLYDLRIKYFGDEADVLDKKAFYAYRFNKDDKDELKGLYELLDRVIELKGDEAAASNAVAFMDVVRRHKLLNKAISDEKALEHYDQIMSVLDSQLATGQNTDRIEKYKSVVDDLLLKTVEIDCKFVESNFGPKVKSNPEDLELAKKTYKLLRAGGCSDGPLYMSTMKTIYTHEPTFGIAEHLAQKHMDKKEYAEAEKYFNDAIKMTDDNGKKGDIYYTLAKTYGNLGRRAESRSMAYKALEADPSVSSKVYTHIGNLYLNSQDCYGGQSLVQDRAIFLAAHKMYQKAGNAAAMELAAKQFPSAEEIFNENKSLGQDITVGCWINETVTLQKR